MLLKDACEDIILLKRTPDSRMKSGEPYNIMDQLHLYKYHGVFVHEETLERHLLLHNVTQFCVNSRSLGQVDGA